MKLGIVGHAEDKFTRRTKSLAKLAIIKAVQIYRPEVIVSGRSPLGGVDLYAEEIAKKFKIPTTIFAPKVNTWDGEGGFKDRNLQIAKESDVVLVVVVEKYRKNYQGMKFGTCYHCKGRNPEHVKSGGCWTAWKCKARKWVIIK